MKEISRIGTESGYSIIVSLSDDKTILYFNYRGIVSSINLQTYWVEYARTHNENDLNVYDDDYEILELISNYIERFKPLKQNDLGLLSEYIDHEEIGKAK